jgi:DNA-binding transcriptional ArsR family regulator
MSKPHVPTDESRRKVAELLAGGLSTARLGRELGIDQRALRKHYRNELDEAGRHRPPVHEPTPQTRAMVWMMSATGVKLEDIGRAMGVHKATVTRHYKDETSRGLLEANTKVSASLFKLTQTPGPQQAISCMFWLKTRAHWQERSTVEVAGAGGGQLIVYSGALAAHDKDA